MHIAYHRPGKRNAGFGKQAVEPGPDQRTIRVKEVEGGNVVDCSYEKKRTVVTLEDKTLKKCFV